MVNSAREKAEFIFIKLFSFISLFVKFIINLMLNENFLNKNKDLLFY